MELTPGKRYRWTVEGTASDFGLLVGDGALLHKTLGFGDVELLPDPLPTTPGSVIWTKEGDPTSGLLGPFPWMKGLDSDWTDGYGNYRREPEMAELTVVRTFDAGAE